MSNADFQQPRRKSLLKLTHEEEAEFKKETEYDRGEYPLGNVRA